MNKMNKYFNNMKLITGNVLITLNFENIIDNNAKINWMGKNWIKKNILRIRERKYKWRNNSYIKIRILIITW